MAAPTDDFVTTWKTDNPGTSGPTEITIPMIGGPYDVDWNNDGTFDQIGVNDAVTHDFGVAGTYTIRIRGDYTSIRFENSGDAEKILSIDQWGTGAWQSMASAFEGAANLQVPATDTPDFSAVTNMSSMFRLAPEANPDTSGWDTGNVTSMAFMFDRASAANPDTSSWNTGNVTGMRFMFASATSANPDTSGWDTSNVTAMNGMFQNATLADPDTSGWDTTAVTNMSLMFLSASSANPDTSGWNTGNVTAMLRMFDSAIAANPDVSSWNVGSLENASGMFNFSGLTQANYDALLENWSQQAVQPNVTLGATGVSYCSGAAAAGRAVLTGAPNNWTIIDQGQDCPEPFVTTWKTDNPGTSGPTEITIPMIGGPYDVDWNNDGTFDQIGVNDSVTHDFGAAGTYTVRIRGGYTSIRFAGGGDAEKILSIDQWGDGAWETMLQAFQGAVNLQVPATDTPDFSNVSSTFFMFQGASAANPDTSAWDVSNVNIMYGMFADASAADPDTSNWNTGNVGNMALMFSNAVSADPDTSGWNTSNVTSMEFMFNGATSANPDVSGWNTANVTRMDNMFLGATAANPDVSGWNVESLENADGMFNFSGLTQANYEVLLENWSAQTVQPNVSLGASTVAYCSDAAAAARAVLTSAPNNWTIIDQGQDCSEHFVTTWKTDNPGTSGPTEITIPMIGGPYDVDWNNDGTFDQIGLSGSITHDFGTAGTYTVRIRGDYTSIRFDKSGDVEKILSVDQWGAGTWQTMDSAFEGAVNLTVPATDTPDFSAVISMAYMFQGAVAANPDTSGWDTGNVINMAFMFDGASAADPDTSGWDTSSVQLMSAMFQFAEAADPDTSGWDTSSVLDMAFMFRGAVSADPDTSGWDTSSVGSMTAMFLDAEAADPDTSGWDTSSVLTMTSMFEGATSADPDTSSWDVSNVFNMFGMFQGATEANPDTSGWDTSNVTFMRLMFSNASAADPDVSQWDTSNVTNMGFMFFGAVAANPDTSAWDTSAVTNMESMFSGAESADPDVSQWDTSAVTDMSFLFRGASSADPDTSNWNTANVTDMRSMFSQATSANPDTSNWNTSNVTDMSFMFSRAAAANPDTSGWNVQALEDATAMFIESGLTSANYEALLENWSAQTVQPNVTLGVSTSYCSDAAAAGRAVLTGAPNNWTIDDLGQACFADLSVSKTDGLETINAGESISYTITVTNAGPDPVIGASVTDQLPPELINPTADCTPSAGAACTIIGPTEIEVDLPAGASVTIDLSADVDPTAVGIIINEVIVNVPDNIADPDPDNNVATDETATDGLFKDRFEGAEAPFER